MSASFTIGELAERTGVSRRTVHYYVQRGLVDPAHGRGRAACYTERHVAQILEVRGRQRDGMGLEQIRATRPGGGDFSTAAVTPSVVRTGDYARTAVVRIRLGDRLVLEVSGRGRPPTDDVLDRLATACAQVLLAHEEEDGAEG